MMGDHTNATFDDDDMVAVVELAHKAIDEFAAKRVLCPGCLFARVALCLLGHAVENYVADEAVQQYRECIAAIVDEGTKRRRAEQ